MVVVLLLDIRRVNLFYVSLSNHAPSIDHVVHIALVSVVLLDVLRLHIHFFFAQFVRVGLGVFSVSGVRLWYVSMLRTT